MKAKEWALENCVRVYPRKTKEIHFLNKMPIYNVTVYVNGVKIDYGSYAPSPLYKGNFDQHVYNDVLSYIHYYLPLLDYDDNEGSDKDLADMVKTFCNSLSLEAKYDFIDGFIEFDEEIY